MVEKLKVTVMVVHRARFSPRNALWSNVIFSISLRGN
jgi:hypothetical protein